MYHLLIFCFLFTTCTCAGAADHISINCGGPASISLTGREWSGDAAAKGASTVRGQLTAAVDPVPYSTARISRSPFSYSFHLPPGQKFIRLHFNPLSFNDLFTVQAGPFTLLANFSASITARALSLTILAKEFCILTHENQPLNILFSPETGHNYAFINGIEIISVPSTISYCHGGDTGVHVLGQKSVIYVDNTTALERVYRQNIKWDSVSFANDIGGMFGVWASLLQGNPNKGSSNLSYGVSVDVGFRYLVRVHLCDLGILHNDFVLLIDNIVALTSHDMLQRSQNQSILWYNYMLMVKGNKREDKHRISISLHSQHQVFDRHGPVEGFEVFKLSNHHLSLATPNPLPPQGDSPPHSVPTLLHSLLGRKNAIATMVFANIFLVNVIVHLLHEICGTAGSSEEENEPSCRAKQPCRRFSLADIQSATENFHSGFIIGKGGFGKVYKGFIDNGREIVAVKRLKPNSNQGGQQFWTEVEMLSELRHVNLVPLLGFCVEQHEMILVYEYMPCGTLDDHLFKLPQKSHDYNPLSWKQRLKICIGAGRALDYLHTGHGIIHRDVKSSNILLDEKFVAKVSDFGLAKTGFGSDSQSQHSTLVKGTRGYLDPNYCETHKPTKSSDTYSFGVVLLEVLCGRRALERFDDEDKCRLTTWAIDNISKGQVDHIVLPSLLGEIAPDSLTTFVKVAKRCLHDQPKKRPAIAHIVMKLELALQQQEEEESLDPNERTGVENLFSSTDKYNKDNMNFMVPNALPQMENVTPSAPIEIINVTDAMPRTDNDRTILSISPKHMASKTVTFLPSQQINSTMINSGRQGGRKSMMLRISRKLWPWDAFWKTKRPSKNTSVSAPISRRASSTTMDGNTERIDGMVLSPAAESSNENEQHRRTMRVMDNISMEEVDDIVAPTLRGQISPDSLRTFVNIAEKWLHDEPKKRPTTINIVTKIELTLQQQEMEESSPPKDRTEVGSSSTSTSQKLDMKLFGPNEKINVSDDASPSPAGQVSSSTGTSKKENVELLGANKTINVVDDARPSLAGQVPSSTGTSQKATVKLFGSIKKINVADDASPSPAGKDLTWPNFWIFTYAELKAATRNFRSDSVLGEGGFGKVYKGSLDDRVTGKTTIVAVKKLNSESRQGFTEWQSEVNFLGRLSHPNLVKLLGYCHEDKQLLLVYEFMPKGSLENHMFRRGASVQPLPWDIRLKILIGTARGLAFLHASDRTVIYRDFKTSNILLDGSYQAKLSDFGLARLGPNMGHSHVTTRIMGTYGYAAPEYVATGHLYVKSDVYGFGVVLLEMLTGLRALDMNRPSGQHNLVEWMKPYLSNMRKLKQVIDVRVEGQYPTKAALQIAKLASTCLESDPKRRPSTQEIVEILERIGTRPTQHKLHFSQ